MKTSDGAPEDRSPTDDRSPSESAYRLVRRRPDTPAFAALFETTGWNGQYGLDEVELGRALDQSDLVVGAYSGDRLVGVGRVVSDGVVHALIADVIVDPAFQHRGIGTGVMRLLLEHCLDRRIRDIQLFCARGKRGFYERLGFRARDDDAPGMEYVGPARQSSAEPGSA